MSRPDSSNNTLHASVLVSSFQEERQIVQQALLREQTNQDIILAYLVPMVQDLGTNLTYANVILAVGFPQRDTANLRAARCQLAIALESLALAQRIHRLKMVTERPSDTTQAGTAVLLGDHHFARAAQIVTQLANPPLLEAFAHVLKMASTQEVASLVAKSRQELLTRAAITTFGIQCGAFLSEIQSSEVAHTAAAWKELADPQRANPYEVAINHFLSQVPIHQKERWRTAADEYLAWNGDDSF